MTEFASGAAGAAPPPTAPVHEGETMAEKVARIKAEGLATSGQTAPTSGIPQSPNKTTTADSPARGASDPQHAASTSAGESGNKVPGSTGVGAAKTKDTAQVTSALGEKTARVTDGSVAGERIRAADSSLIPESNDVMLGDQSSRAPGGVKENGPPGAPESLKLDGSKSPHDPSSEGGSRQADAHKQVKDAASGVQAAGENPAFQAAAKERTI